MSVRYPGLKFCPSPPLVSTVSLDISPVNPDLSLINTPAVNESGGVKNDHWVEQEEQPGEIKLTQTCQPHRD